LLAFIHVAREGSFTRAAAQLGVSPSALSHSVRALEARMDLRLLTRTTRSVSMTEAGARLYESTAPRFEEIDAELLAATEQRRKPAGTVRITTLMAAMVGTSGGVALAEDYKKNPYTPSCAFLLHL